MNYDQIIKLNEDIEELVYNLDVSYMDAILVYCEEKGMEFEVIAPQLSGMINEQVRKEAIELRLLVDDEIVNELPL